MLAEDQLDFIEPFCARPKSEFAEANFKLRQKIIGPLDVRGKIAFEGGKRVMQPTLLIEPREP